MQSSTLSVNEPSRLLRYLLDPLVLGTICGLTSAVAYTAANVCLRAVSDCDAMWVSCIKAFPTVVLFGPWLILGWLRYGLPAANWRALGILVMTALICQLCGNVAFQWALGIIGIALVVPITLGTIIISGALMGRIFLHEAVTIRTACSILTLMIAICVLSLGAGEASASILPSHMTPSVGIVAAGVGMACLSGLAYSLLGVVIRYSVRGTISVTATIVTVTLTGVVTLGALSFGTVGLAGMLATDPGDFATMTLAGVFNALAFVALTKSLQLVPIVYVNALNATQATMAALAGIIFFAESQTVALWFGVGLTVVGLMLMQHRQKKAAQDSATSSSLDSPHDTKAASVSARNYSTPHRPACSEITGPSTSETIRGS